MSFEAAAWAIKQRTKTATDKLVLIVLSDCHNRETGACFPSYKFVADHAQCSERQVGRSINSLEEYGLITVQRDKGKSNNYNLNFNTPDKLSGATNKAKPRTNETKPLTPCPATPDTMSYEPGSNQELKPVIETSKALSTSAQKNHVRGTRLNPDFVLPKDWGNWALESGLTREQVIFEAEKFRDYWVSISGQKGVKMDWLATWRNWIRNSITYKNVDFVDFEKMKREAREDHVKKRFDPHADF